MILFAIAFVLVTIAWLCTGYVLVNERKENAERVKALANENRKLLGIGVELMVLARYMANELDKAGDTSYSAYVTEVTNAR